MSTKEEYKRAEHDLMLAESRRGFRIHAAVFVLVNTGLTLLNVLLVVYTSASFLWFPFPIICWGLGLTMHYVFGVRGAEHEIERRQWSIEQRAERLHLAA